MIEAGTHRIRKSFALACVLCLCRGYAEPTETFTQNGLDYLRRQQADDGSFGQPQPHLKTGLAVLAMVSVQTTLNPKDTEYLERATAFLIKTSETTGDLGDDMFRTESHSIALLAMICSHEFLKDAKLKEEAAQRISRGLKYLMRLQDRSSSSSSRGGWRMEGRKGRTNDRRASAWALLTSQTAALYGMEVPKANVERGVRYLLGSFKTDAESKDQIGGLSVDTLGLTVNLMSSMGGWALARFDGKPSMLKKNIIWLEKHPQAWKGPNYFYSTFFRLRALKFMDQPKLYTETKKRISNQLQDHQGSDGGLGFPPGNAQNTIAMGSVFTTAMGILIINVENSRLPGDEDYRVEPRFQ
jgi:hypothetical protein